MSNRQAFFLCIFVIYLVGGCVEDQPTETTTSSSTTTSFVDIPITTSTAPEIPDNICFSKYEILNKRVEDKLVEYGEGIIEPELYPQYKGIVNPRGRESCRKANDILSAILRSMDKGIARMNESNDLMPLELRLRKLWVINQTNPYLPTASDFGYSIPDERMISVLKRQITAGFKYPPKINGVFERNPQSNAVDLFLFSDELRDLGVNTFFVVCEFIPSSEGVVNSYPVEIINGSLKNDPSRADRAAIHRLYLAKRQGFSVGLILDYSSLKDIGKYQYDLEYYEPQFEANAHKWAKIAEEYNVEYFVPMYGFESLMYSNGYNPDQVISATNDFYDRLGPIIQEEYEGKIILGFGKMSEWNELGGISARHSDMIGVGGVFDGESENISGDFFEMTNIANAMAKRDKKPWLVLDFLSYTPQDNLILFGRESNVSDQEDSYRQSLGVYSGFENDSAGFVFSGWTGIGAIRGSRSAGYVRELFRGG